LFDFDFLTKRQRRFEALPWECALLFGAGALIGASAILTGYWFAVEHQG
jgi:hypothetical protein